MAQSIRPNASRPQLHRIAGLSAAIVLNAGLVLLLLVPMRGPPATAMPSVTQVIAWIRPKPVPPPPPEPVPVEKKQATHPSVAHPRPADPPADTVPPVVMASETLPVEEPVVEPPTVVAEHGNGGSQPGMRLEYDRAPAPPYPRDALRDGIEGTVLLQVLVDVDGRPLKVDVQRSSGDRRLDIAARRQVLANWRFRPAMRDGRPVQALGLVPIDFRLGN